VVCHTPAVAESSGLARSFVKPFKTVDQTSHGDFKCAPGMRPPVDKTLLLPFAACLRMLFDFPGEALGKGNGLLLANNLLFQRDFSEDADCLLECLHQRFLMRLPEQQLNFERIAGVLHTQELPYPPMRLVADTLGRGQIERKRFEAVPYAVLPCVLELHLIILNADLLRLEMPQNAAQTQENKANFLESHIPTKRMGTPEEIANAIVFIASDKASYIIGASLAGDGGMTAG
jgi:Enoyl-(Acyl carrier protein) reductase